MLGMPMTQVNKAFYMLYIGKETIIFKEKYEIDYLNVFAMPTNFKYPWIIFKLQLRKEKN